jgi:hypothetical protein
MFVCVHALRDLAGMVIRGLSREISIKRGIMIAKSGPCGARWVLLVWPFPVAQKANKVS